MTMLSRLERLEARLLPPAPITVVVIYEDCLNHPPLPDRVIPVTLPPLKFRTVRVPYADRRVSSRSHNDETP